MNRLKELRQEKGLTQQALADEIGVFYRTIQNWENGKSQIKPEKAQQLADYFGVSVGYLLGYEMDTKESESLENNMDDFHISQKFDKFLDFLFWNSYKLDDVTLLAIFNLMISNDSYKTTQENLFFTKPINKNNPYSIYDDYYNEQKELRGGGHL